MDLSTDGTTPQIHKRPAPHQVDFERNREEDDYNNSKSILKEELYTEIESSIQNSPMPGSTTAMSDSDDKSSH